MRAFKLFTSRLQFRLFWQRVTFSKITTAFFFLALVHCIVQVSLEAFAFSINASALNLLESIVAASNDNSDASSVVIFNDQNLTVCDGVPSASTCKVVWAARGADTIDPVAAIPDTAPAYTYAATPIPTPSQTQTQTHTQAFHAGGVVALDTKTPTGFQAPAATKVVTVSFVNPDQTADTDDDGHVDSDDLPQLARIGGTTFQLKRDSDASIQRKINSTGGFLGVSVQDPHLAGGQAFASPTCIASLQVPIQSLRNTKRVDLTFIAFQIWVLGMSVVALLNESVPHIIASLLTHLLATAWSGYQLHMTGTFKAQVTRLIVQGPCQKNLLPEYWTPRINTEVSVVVLNTGVMVAIAFLSYRLIKSFGWQTFKRIGASLVINRVYRLVLAFSIIIQLSVFFIGANVTLWIDQLYNGNIARYAEHRGVYEVVYIFVLSILLPWLTIGWFSVRRESRFWMHVFIILGTLMIGGWTLMFASNSFLWTFKMWDFFAVMTVTAAVLLSATLALGIVCRLNFGKGLPRYLNNVVPEDEPEFVSAEGKEDKYLEDDEKAVDFPSRDGSPIPTFSHVFGTGADALPSLMRLASSAPGRAAPGINMHARGSSASDPEPPAYPAPAAVLGRQLSASSARGDAASLDTSLALARTDSAASYSSYGSSDGATAGHRSDAGRSGGGRRWLIE